MKTAAEFLREGAKTFEDRNAVYGNNYLNVGKAFEGFFPEGVTIKTADDWNRMHILMLQIVKLSRYCNNFEKGGHADSIHDATVYSAMLESIDAEIASREIEFSEGETVITHNNNGQSIKAIVINKQGGKYKVEWQGLSFLRTKDELKMVPQ